MVAESVVHALQADAIAASVLRALHDAGIAAILLKGSALADLYPDRPRTYVDADIYIDPPSEAAAARLLTELGWTDIRAGALGIERTVHASTWSHPRLPSSVDLHRTLVGIGVPPNEAWALLSTRTEPFEVAGQRCLRLDPGARALHLSLHASQSGMRAGQVLEDLERGAARFDVETWREAARLADGLGATAPFAAGLGMTPRAAALLELLGIASDERDARLRLDVAGASSGAKSLAIMRDRATRRDRAWYAARRVFPSRALMVATEPLAARGRLGLAAAYGVRFVRVLWRSPTAVREYAAALRAGPKA